MKNVLVTGCGGFIGRKVLASLLDGGYRVIGVVREPRDYELAGASITSIGEIGAETDWAKVLDPDRNAIAAPVESIIHLAARAHIFRKNRETSFAEIKKVNVEGTKRILMEAARFGVKRFVYVSSIGVLGSSTDGREPLSASDIPFPENFYTKSKLDAEIEVQKCCFKLGMEFVIVRPPLVYGPGAPGNFSRLLKLLDSPVPIPLGAIENKRSLISRSKLAKVLVACIESEKAANRILVVADGVDVSTTEILTCLRIGLERRRNLFAIPLGVLRLFASIVGARQEAEQLLGSLQVDGSLADQLLGIDSTVNTRQGLIDMAISFKNREFRQLDSIY